MKLNFRISLSLLALALCCTAAHAERTDLEFVGMVPADMTAAELADNVTFELVLQPYSFDARKRQGPEGTMGLMGMASSYEQVVTWLKKLGFTVLETDPSCVTIRLEGTREQIATGLQITFVRETGSTRSLLVPVPGHSLPYRPAGSLLSIDNLLVDLSPGVSPEDSGDQHLVKEWHPIHDQVAGS